jgi:hypothetical protein
MIAFKLFLIWILVAFVAGVWMGSAIAWASGDKE